MGAAKSVLPVEWFPPTKKPRKRPAMRTTTATSDLLCLLAEDGATWTEVAERINFDDDARAVADLFINAGHGDTPARHHLTRRSADPARQLVAFSRQELAAWTAGARPEPSPLAERTITMTLADFVMIVGQVNLAELFPAVVNLQQKEGAA